MFWLQWTCGDRAHVAEKYPEELAKTIAFDLDSARETFHGFDDVFPIDDGGDMDFRWQRAAARGGGTPRAYRGRRW